MTSVTVTKCHGTGNDFLLLDARDLRGLPYAELARELCRRRFSIGADGLLVLEQPAQAGCTAAMRIFNADGSEAEMCGNGVRCVARFLHEQDPGQRSFDIQTRAGAINVEVIDWCEEPGARVRMGTPRFMDVGRTRHAGAAQGDVVCHAVDMGNPHLVAFCLGDVDAMDLDSLASILTDGDPDRTNVELAMVAGPGEIAMRVRERGVGETLACGTGACAVAVCAINAGKTASPVKVRSKGGVVGVEWAGPGSDVFLSGNAHLVFRTEIAVLRAATPAGS